MSMNAMFYFTENSTFFNVNVTMWNVDIGFVVKNMNLCICLLKEYYQDIVCGILVSVPIGSYVSIPINSSPSMAEV